LTKDSTEKAVVDELQLESRKGTLKTQEWTTRHQVAGVEKRADRRVDGIHGL